MASSKTDICNLALALLDEDPIQDLDSQQEPRASVLRINFPNSFDAAMLERPWNACRKRQVLSKDTAAPVFGFDFQFTLPADCLQVHAVTDASSGYTVDKWSVESGRKLLCNWDSVGVIYSARIEQIPQLPAYLTEVISYHLAFRTARAITGSDSKGAALREEYQRAVLPNAQHRDALEGFSGENMTMQSTLRRSGILRARRANGPLTRP